MATIATPITDWTLLQVRRSVLSLGFAITAAVGVCLLLAAHVLSLLAAEGGEQAWSIGLSTAAAVGALWGVLDGSSSSAGSRSTGLDEMLDASGLGASGRWAAGLLARTSTAILLLGLLMYSTLVLSYLTNSRSVTAGRATAGAASAIASVCVAATWSRLIGLWLSATGAAIGAFGLWLAGQAGPSLPWAALLPPAAHAAESTPVVLLRATLLVGCLVAAALAELARRRV